MATVKSLYIEKFGDSPDVVRLPSAGSDRLYFRLQSANGPTVVGTEGRDRSENRAFVELAETFRKNGAPVPEIFSVSEDFGCYLQEDLGDIDLLSQLKTEEGIELCRKSLESLVGMQTVDSRQWERLTMSRPFSRRMVMWDLNYFKYEFLKTTATVYDEESLEDDFERMADTLLNGDHRLWGFMYRDFQSRNIMIKDGRPRFIDFQGGRLGPMVYDAVSFLWQVKAGFTTEQRGELLNHYASHLSAQTGAERENILKETDRYVLFRTLQVLGAYGFRGLVEKRAHFIESIPGALANLKSQLSEGKLDGYPELKRVSELLVQSRFAGEDKDGGQLEVKVFSFSYKKGYPEDLTGNGGGFMFDCRGMHNPGRYEEFKPLTGLDGPVRRFLEEKGEVGEFIRQAVEIVSPSVECYRRRNFRSLQVGFGCTGGRHRSVYCAEGFAGELSRRFPDVRVRLIHREQGIDRVFNGDNKGKK